ncbi:hypothetical protein GX563_02575 [Candidatus Bathyarchaeota archaeon]|nr:hypothetical protein [Candidatus Bathyarchaeota archaeon]
MTKCPGCGKEFSSYSELIDHVVEAHEATCQVCGARLGSRHELLLHNKEKHGIS